MPNPEPIARTKERSRIDGIDILRGLSIFFVVMNHIHMRLYLSRLPYTEGLPAQLVSSLVWNGQRGVQIFFCISGFLIASTSLKRWGSLENINARAFYGLRFARIAPLFLALLILLSCLHFTNLPDFIVAEKSGGLAKALVAACTFRINQLEANLGYLPPNWDILWSLSVEEMFYLFFPLVCILASRLKLMPAVLFVFVILGPPGRTWLAQGNEVWEEYSYLGSMDAIALGVLTAILESRLRLSRLGLSCVAGVGSSLVAFCLFSSRMVNAWGFNRLGLGMTLLEVGTCFVVFAASQSGWRAPRLLSPLMILGARSYEIYLTHIFVILAFFHLFVGRGSLARMIPILFTASIVFSGILGELVARSYSEPLNLLIRKALEKGHKGKRA